MKKSITIAGSDSSGGAGIQTDLKTFAAHGVYGMSVITAVTAQNTLGVSSVESISPQMVKAQIRSLFEDIEVDSVKIGMLSEIDIIEAVYDMFKFYNPKNIVLDPVMVSTSGFDLVNTKAKHLLIHKLMPLADVLTPNLSETQCILNEIGKCDIEELDSIERMIKAGKIISEFMGNNILIKGGHLKSNPCDVLVTKDKKVILYDDRRIDTKNTHGTGCTLSSAIAANLALGYDVEVAVGNAKEFISNAISNSLDIGRGCGPTNPMGEIYKKLGMEV
ncbi:bifunctional hydroxymethylpyrimidine kinase/phosphomethylpyrimidine kinase [Peptostreptococcus canis]|uniref:Hydroxymethylpyrimidine/phosphomethylpyrimidine kinase n=1 Tax=Peptostreptococcus canis TaxID=1159213 RepID=A0ABR6TJX0_9FIRM|nr:bifunctional hydroxymethylpyrimidine kinase/phosphomethylpyrimidine kinase [Peptostreptococcus canis]MBC2575605.1 bifunctional hydroxymethylpyrimidine kinase/phosphomethylpyrimidine kinase [Peptostreptococcus canis]MBP1997191.1 hydroxymethylpyrimidine/phosphomethylpyrimidine kinase [Peptostreptococcus canis]